MLPRAPGIYKITCHANDKIYIGSGVNVYRRWLSYHRPQLRRNKHCNRHLQAAWNKYGEGCFICEVVETCSRADLLRREQHWIDTHNATNHKIGFNIAKTAGSTLGVSQSEKCKAILRAVKSKTYIVRDPKGREQTITNLLGFCRQHGLQQVALNRVAKCKARHHRNWECRPVDMTREQWLARIEKLPPRRPDKIKDGQVWCSRCKTYKESAQFTKNTQNPSGFAAYCCACRNPYQREYYRKRVTT